MEKKAAIHFKWLKTRNYYLRIIHSIESVCYVVDVTVRNTHFHIDLEMTEFN